MLWCNCRAPAVFDDGGFGNVPAFVESVMLEYRPVSSTHLLATEHPRCPGCKRSRMVLCRIAPGPSGFDTRTFECQKCGHVHTLNVSRDPHVSHLQGWLAGELKPPT
jgi:hypothetical protein